MEDKMKPNSLEAAIEVDLWSKADIRGVDECWEWKGRVHKGRPVYVSASSPVAARTAYALYYEKHPGEMLVLHSCDNGICVNPGHLFLGTTQDNIADKVSKGRQAKGSMFGRAKVNEGQVAEILERYTCGGGHRELAAEFGIPRTCVYSIAQRKTWKHVPCDEKMLAVSRWLNWRESADAGRGGKNRKKPSD
jgi:hypothetical protein